MIGVSREAGKFSYLSLGVGNSSPSMMVRECTVLCAKSHYLIYCIEFVNKNRSKSGSGVFPNENYTHIVINYDKQKTKKKEEEKLPY